MFSAELTDAAIFAIGRRHGDLSMHAAVDLKRPIAREEIESALRDAIAAFPVLGHCYRPALWRDRWIEVAAPIAESVHVEGIAMDGSIDARTAEWVKRPIAVTRERPIRLVGLRQGDRMRLILTLLHIVGDGAAMAAVSHVLGSALRGGRPALPTDARRSSLRALDGLRWPHVPVLAGAAARLALEPLRQLRAARPRPSRSEASESPSFTRVIVGRDELDALKRRCRTSVNDVLIAALARVAGERSRRGPVAITYTMDLRRYAKEARLTAANSSSILQAIVPRQALGDLTSAARAVSEITARQRRRLAGPAFMLAPHALLAGVPHAAVRRMAPVFAPVLVDLPLGRGLLVTNVGRIDDALGAFGDDVEDFRFIGPLIERVPIPVVVAFGYRGNLHLELFSPRQVGRGALDELARDVGRELGAAQDLRAR